MTDDDYRAVRLDVRRKLSQWADLDDLADKMLSQAAQGKRVVLSPGTADWLARWMKGKIK